VREIRAVSDLDAPAEVVWRHAVSPQGVNMELRPLLRMTFPAGAADILDTWQPGQRLFRSWILLGGVVPVEYDDLAIVELEPGRRFLERSHLLTQRVWEHERTVEPRNGGCRLSDRVGFEPRSALLGPLHAAVFAIVFRLRHRNLRRRFGGRPVL